MRARKISCKEAPCVGERKKTIRRGGERKSETHRTIRQGRERERERDITIRQG